MAILDIFKKGKEDKHFKDKSKKAPTVLPVATESVKTEKSRLTAELTPIVSEKAYASQSKGVYVFKVSGLANRATVRGWVKKVYGVVPRKVNIINTPAKPFAMRRHRVSKPGFAKAIVFLKAGETITI